MSTVDDGLRVVSRDGGPVPFGYTVQGPGVDTVISAHATFDGTGASGAFLPSLAFYQQNGVLLGRFFPDTGAVAAGSTADVSYGPFLGSGPGSGIRFDTYPQAGDWLEIQTTGVHTVGFQDRGGMHIDVDGTNADMYVNVNRDENHEVGNDLNLDTGHDVNITTANDGLVEVTNTLRVRAADVELLAQVYDLAGTTSIRLTPGGTTAQFYADGGIWLWDARPQSAFGVQIILGAGSKLEVQDHNQNPIFRINEDGSLQGKTGKALTFNL